MAGSEVGVGGNTDPPRVLGAVNLRRQSDGAEFGSPAAPVSTASTVGGAALSATNPAPITNGSAAGTNRSASVGTSAANLMAANASRKGWKVKNDSANAIWINFYGAASAVAGGGNVKISAGGYLASEPGYVETGAMSAIAETGAVNITAYEF